MTTSLTLTENTTISKLPVQMQQIVIAKFQKPIKSIKDFDLATSIKNMLIISHAELGITVEGKDQVVSFLRDTLLKDFRGAKYEHISFDLIKLFVSNGIRGEYGTFKNQMNTISIQNIHYWINEGLKSEKYKHALKEFNLKLDEENKQNTVKPMQDGDLMYSCLSAFETYKETGELPSFGAHAYYDIIKRFLNLKTLILNEDWQAVKKEAKFNYINLTKSKAARKADIPGMLKKLSFDGTGQHEFEIKKVGLKFYFDRLIKENKNLEFTDVKHSGVS
jgi:hypothetical protein